MRRRHFHLEDIIMKVKHGNEVWELLTFDECMALTKNELWTVFACSPLAIFPRPDNSLIAEHMDAGEIIEDDDD
jgi:hypothetical protein